MHLISVYYFPLGVFLKKKSITTTSYDFLRFCPVAALKVKFVFERSKSGDLMLYQFYICKNTLYVTQRGPQQSISSNMQQVARTVTAGCPFIRHTYSCMNISAVIEPTVTWHYMPSVQSNMVEGLHSKDTKGFV